MLIAAAAMAAMSGQPATCMFAMASSLETETSRWWLIWCRNEYVTLGGGSCSRDQEINAPPKPLFRRVVPEHHFAGTLRSAYNLNA